MSGPNGRQAKLNSPGFGHGHVSLLLLSILYMASLGLVCPSAVHAVGTPAGSALTMGGDGGAPNVADAAGDIVANAVSTLFGGTDTAFLTTKNGSGVTQADTTIVQPVYGDTMAALTPVASALPGDTAVIDLIAANKGNTTDVIVFDSTAPMFQISGAAGSLVKVTFLNGPGTTEISNLSIPADGAASFKVAVFFSPSAPQGDTVTFTVTAKARGGLGGDLNGYTGNNGVSYAGIGDATAGVTAISGAVALSTANRVAFFGGDTHLLASGGSVTISVVVRNDTGIVVPGAQVDFSVTNPTPDPTASLSAPNATTDAQGRASVSLTLGTASSYYRVKAQVSSTGAFQNYYAYNNRLNIPGLDTSAANIGKGWRMWAPNKSTPPGPNISSVIQSPPSTVGTGNPAVVYEWQTGVSPNSSLNNTQYYAPGSIVRGRAYWIKDNEGGLLEVPGAGDTNVTVYDTLVGRGWHQVGSGQFYFVDWTNGVRFAKAETGQVFLPPLQARDSGLIKNAIYWRNDVANNYVFGPDTSIASLTQVQMKPMAGFWLWVDTDAPVVMKVMPSPVAPQETATEILNQAPKYLSAMFRQQGKSADESGWKVQMIAQSAAGTDMQNYVGVMPSADAASRSSLYEPPSVASGYMTLGIRDPDAVSAPLSAASYAPPVTTAKSWNVEVYTDVNSPVTLSWDNVTSIPEKYSAFLVTPAGVVDMRKAATYQMPAFSGKQSLTFAVGLPDYLAGFLAAPLSKDVTFVYPNPGPDVTGIMNFKHNITSGEVKIKIFDVGGGLVKELTGTTSPIPWDTTNRFGQKVGSGVYIYILESSGNKLVDKLAIVR